MLTIDVKNTPTAELHQHLLGCVSPRPIAFASTIDEDGNPNIAPYSFFNVFSSNPPIAVFSSNRKVSDNTTKDTLHNIQATGEVVINAVSHSILRQMAIASIAFPTETSEFEKAGLTPIPSELVKPFRVKESPAHLECKVREIIPLGDQGGAGHLIICEVVRIHIDKNVLDEERKIDPHKIDLMGRMGRAFYVRASGEAVMKIVQSVGEITIGYDGLPDHIKNSPILSGNNIGQLAGMKSLPSNEEILAIKKDEKVQRVLSTENVSENLHQYAKAVLNKDDDRKLAAKLLLLEKLI